MKVLVLTITCGLMTVLQALDPPSLALEGLNMTGTWYVKAWVADKSLLKRRPKAVSPITLDVLDGGYLEASFTFLKKGQCHEVRAVMRSTGEPGKFSLAEGERYLHMEPLPVEDHYIMYCEGPRLGRSAHVGKLIGRSPDVNPEALEAFRKFVRSKGLPLEDILLPAQMEKCVPESD
ncbi:odorant-binding protein 2b-like [Phyllostomus discolor]|uniref:Odorant-binding protein 2b-like n=1 Tax=Phyllostomus discolor TaxID=89673 RepID=A0A7E6DH76_9CHIR|nr:odorant-binding protein 2b-like [Phyllostomus discolor]